MNNKDTDALVTRLRELEDPEKEAFPSVANTDWRTLAGVVASEIESLRQQLSDSQKREVMLRTALEDFLKQYPHMAKGYLLDALAATDDLNDLILCHAEPVAWITPEYFTAFSKQGFVVVTHKIAPDLVPLYRAWEPLKVTTTTTTRSNTMKLNPDHHTITAVVVEYKAGNGRPTLGQATIGEMPQYLIDAVARFNARPLGELLSTDTSGEIE